ncbi:hypothetical protein [Thiolapillus brandeum]|uniref:Uncharacterized protein n=1 Tax=Thiolapillus brandeum TaxID=1076588 RepID=A0A7U6JGM1_9GAMM|nr:hypothetical protein [Thiolapillus brandeum]BAO43042.1 hypothetical protein TBH_C0094 [Thiolapillus brandeum]
MNTQERQDKHPLQGMNVEDMVSWLERGLRGYLQGEDGAWAFGAAAFFIGRQEHLVLDIREMYRELRGSAKVDFRKAVATLLARLPAEQEDVVLFEHLLSIAAAVGAYEVLPVLRRRVGRGFFGLTDSMDGHNLFAQTLDLVAGLATAPDKEVLKTLDYLVESPNFDPAYADLALLAYCRVEEENLPRHLDKLREAFSHLQEQGVLDSVVASNIVLQVVATLGWREISRVLPLITYVRKPPDGRAIQGINKEQFFYRTDRWFVRILFGGEQPIATWGFNEYREICLQPVNEDKKYVIPEEGVGNFQDMYAFLKEEGRRCDLPEVSEKIWRLGKRLGDSKCPNVRYDGQA